ncbi:MAG: hypothetical protein QM696_05745 [Steroidobacteraceae bacterium]
MNGMHRNRALVFASCAGLALLAGCATVKSHWPFGRAAPPPPPAVNELAVTTPGESPPQVVLQYWERNTLVLDMQNAASTGQILLARREGRIWPARIGFRMSPTRFEALEVRGIQRMVLPVSSEGAGPVTVELPPGVYGPATTQIAVRWGARSSF